METIDYRANVRYKNIMKNRDPEYLAKLRDYYAGHRVLPSFSGIATLVGLNTTSAVAAFAARMKDAGYLDSGPNRRLRPGKLFFERPVVDSVRAGIPQPANDIPVEGLEIDAYLVDNPSVTVLMNIRGDSMKDAGLLPGDIVVVKKSVPASIGDIVVARVDGDFTVKYLAKDKRGYYLKPANDEFDDIRPIGDLNLYGRVVGSIRKY